jgi:hypothetical protein
MTPKTRKQLAALGAVALPQDLLRVHMVEVVTASHLLSRVMPPTRTTSSPVAIPHSNNSSNSLPTRVPTEEMLPDMVNPSNMDTVDQPPVEQAVIPPREAMDRRRLAGTERE